MLRAQTSGRLSRAGRFEARNDSLLEAIRTLRACGLSRVPWQSVQGTISMYFSSCRRRMMFFALR